jgi:hypothetical protein
VAEAKLMNGTIKQAALSPDGQRLYVVGYQSEFTDEGLSETGLGLSVIETATGKLLTQVETDARRVNFLPESDRLLLEVWGQENYAELRWADDLSVAVGTRLNGYLRRGRLLNGETLWLGEFNRPNETEFQVIDPLTFEVRGSWTTLGNSFPLLLP